MKAQEQINKELVNSQLRQATAAECAANIRADEALILSITEGTDDWLWGFWTIGSKWTLSRTFAGTTLILFDSEVATELERIETITGGEFTSRVEAGGDVEYTLETAHGKVLVTAYLTEQGACRKVITGYNTQTRYHSVETTEAVPIYGIVCG